MRFPLQGGAVALALVACTSSSPGSAGAIDATLVDAPASDARAPADAALADAPGPPDAAVSACGPLGTTWSRCGVEPLMTAGFQQPDGRYELSIGDPDVQYDATTRLWRMWWSTGLAARYADDPQLGIKTGESADGVVWTVQPALAIAASTNPADWDSSKLETPSVLYLPQNPPATRYLLYYSGAPPGLRTVNGFAISWYQIGLAVSSDGKSFTRIDASLSPYGKAGLVLEGKDVFPGLPGVADGVVADPEIVFDGTILHLFFSSLAVDSGGAPLAFGVAHATSTDGIHWTPAAGNPIPGLNGSKGPSIVHDPDGTWEMFYQSDSSADLAPVPSTFNPQLGIWRAISTDLTHWAMPSGTRELEWDGSLASERYGWIAVGDMVLVGGEYRYYYPAFSTLAPPSPDWVVPTQTGYQTSLIVLDMARRSQGGQGGQ